MLPPSDLTVIVNTCCVPTAFVLSGVIVMFASTYCFVAGPLSPVWVSPVARWIVTLLNVPITVTAVVAFATKTPGVWLLIVIVHVAVVPEIVGEPQVVLCVPGAGLT